MPSLNGAAVQVAHQSIPLTRQGDPMNRLTLTGRLTADPELRYSTEGTAFCSMRIAVNGVGDEEGDVPGHHHLQQGGRGVQPAPPQGPTDRL
jgi:hypothetical protein